YYQQCLETINPTISFIEPLLTGQYISAEVIQETAGRLGCKLEQVTRLLLGEAGASNVNLSEMQVVVESVANSFGPGIFTAVHNGAIVLLLETGIDAKSLAKAIQERLRMALNETITILISRLLRDLDDIRLGYDELRRSLVIIQRLGKAGSVVAFDELGVYRVLLSVDRSILEELTQRALGPLLKDEHKEELLSTLNSYLRSGGHQQQTAEECFIHLNTVKYRLKKVAQLLNINLSNPEERFELNFVLHALDVLE
ncbi:MAG: helix-turn-helix domain-containing protein, partial [Desulfotomaculaceae bacterium]|nr:helix-turn-helix domain-containing protein [Desulfotomaculaceae bacterium]